MILTAVCLTLIIILSMHVRDFIQAQNHRAAMFYGLVTLGLCAVLLTEAAKAELNARILQIITGGAL